MFFINNDFINFFIYTYQGAVFLYAISKCLKEERKKDRVRWAVSFFIFIAIRLILGCLLDGDVILTVETHSIGFFLICGIVYRERLHFNEVSLKSEVRTLELIICKIVGIFLIMNIIYFAIRYFKVRRIIRLNSKLNYINDELRNVKDYHGEVIENIYDLYKRNSNKEVGELLKDIINNDNKEIKNFKIKKNENNSILHMALIQAIRDGINVNIDEEYSLELVDMDKIELYRIISNITNNARRFVDKNGIINAKTYKEEHRIIIIIENNGPQIEKAHLDKIFLEGFTTQNNHDKNHGYGLNIVKGLVEKNNGTIEVNSTNLLTSFKISLPCS
ncbi:MAG: ATP-binding protein [Romboutsia sp.]|nr:ATP-binding protein [Romboutsia sp.]